MIRRAGLLIAVQLALCGPGRAQTTLTLEDALARAAKAPAVVALEADVDAARARLRLAERLFVTNPDAEYLEGPRRTPDRTTTDRDYSLEQSLSGIIERPGRVAMARAELEEKIAARDEIAQTVTAEVARAVIDALAADERVRAAEADVALTGDLAALADKRLGAGQVTALDANAARAEAARARAESGARQADREKALGALRGLLALPPTETIELATRLADVTPPSREELIATIDRRPEMRRLQAEIDRGHAELELARSRRFPDLALRGQRQDEEDAVIYLLGVRFSVPIFDRGQELRATGAARVAAAEQGLTAARQRIAATLGGQLAAYEKRRQAIDELERDALAPLADNERLSRRAYEVGEIGLAELLAFRQQALAARRETIDRLADAAGLAAELRSTIPVAPSPEGKGVSP